ncbi:hypothetical protein ASF26_21675 [Methylobacterium sp. Leaf93]|nr:hypothetical protein ASF26_21675 [Methylobacterium sp. Leaf93]
MPLSVGFLGRERERERQRQAQSDPFDRDPIQVGPLVEHATGELRSVVHPQAFGPPPQPEQGVGHLSERR